MKINHVYLDLFESFEFICFIWIYTPFVQLQTYLKFPIVQFQSFILQRAKHSHDSSLNIPVESIQAAQNWKLKTATTP